MNSEVIEKTAGQTNNEAVKNKAPDTQPAATTPPDMTINKKENYRFISVERAHTDTETIVAHTRDEYVRLFRTRVQQTARATLDLCRLVYEAWKSLDEANFAAFCQAVGYKDTSSTIRKFLAIGKVQPRLVQYADQLPASWTSIYQLTQIPASTFEKMLNEGKSLNSLSGADVKELVASTREISSITAGLPREKETRNALFAKVAFTKRTVDDADWLLVQRAFAALEARLPIKFVVEQVAENLFDQRKHVLYEMAKRAEVKKGLNPDDWGLGDIKAGKLEPVEESAS
ncbi:hypothetical protein [Devosia sp.]|uniref:hypothetical protein n=1 Tax=Devosia sp. TaxID=1871048 RepID=UPI003BA9462F